jgi:hypothetical protein
VAAASCGDVVRQGASPVFLTIDSFTVSQGLSTPKYVSPPLTSDVLTLVTTGSNGSRACSTSDPCPTTINDLGQVELRLVLKDIGTPIVQATPSTNNEVTITRYHVSYRRADGRNTPGVDVPHAFDGATTGTIPASGTATLGFELVRHVAKEESPLVQLVNNGVVITTIADVTFYGRDRVGNEISATGSVQIDFGNFGG